MRCRHTNTNKLHGGSRTGFLVHRIENRTHASMGEQALD